MRPTGRSVPIPVLDYYTEFIYKKYNLVVSFTLRKKIIKFLVLVKNHQTMFFLKIDEQNLYINLLLTFNNLLINMVIPVNVVFSNVGLVKAAKKVNKHLNKLELWQQAKCYLQLFDFNCLFTISIFI